MIKSPAESAAVLIWNDDEPDATRVEIQASDTRTAIVETSSLGYKRSMRTEVRTAPRWGNPIADYLKYLRAADQSPATIYQRGYQLRVLSQAFRGRSPWTLSTDDLAGFLASQSQHANSTRRAQLSAIRGFYKYGIATGKVRVDPAAALRKIEPTIGKPRPAPIDAVAIAVANADERTRLMIYLGVYAGLRRAEICAVHSDDLIHTRDGWVLRIVGKGRKVRHVPMTPKLAALIQARPYGWIFPSWHRGQVDSDGKTCDEHLRPARVGELIHDALPTGVTTHMLRHRFASNAYVGSGHDIRAVQELLGHSSVATTQIYTEVPNSALWAGVMGGADLIR